MNRKIKSAVAVDLLFQQGYIGRPHEVEAGVFVCKPLQSWERIARAGSIEANGQWKWAKNSCFRNLRGDCARLMTREDWAKLQCSRALVGGITGETPKTSLGALALQLLTWTGEKQTPEFKQKIFKLESKIGYFDCIPGTYENAIHYDMSGCYFHLIERLGGLKINIEFDGNCEVMKPRGEKAERWNHVIGEVSEDKPLRNSLWGSALGKTEEHFFYTKGDKNCAKPYAGPLQTGALLVSRLAYELCQAASYETNAAYSQTDGIITQHAGGVMSWKRYDVPYRIKERGDAIIQGRAAYKIGGAPCGWYDEKSVITTAEARAPFPSVCYADMFLLT